MANRSKCFWYFSCLRIFRDATVALMGALCSAGNSWISILHPQVNPHTQQATDLRLCETFLKEMSREAVCEAGIPGSKCAKNDRLWCRTESFDICLPVEMVLGTSTASFRVHMSLKTMKNRGQHSESLKFCRPHLDVFGVIHLVTKCVVHVHLAASDLAWKQDFTLLAVCFVSTPFWNVFGKQTSQNYPGLLSDCKNPGYFSATLVGVLFTGNEQ